METDYFFAELSISFQNIQIKHYFALGHITKDNFEAIFAILPSSHTYNQPHYWSLAGFLSPGSFQIPKRPVNDGCYDCDLSSVLSP